MYKVDEVAARLRVNPATVYAMVASGKLGAVRVGIGKRGAIRITEAHIEAFLCDEPAAEVARPVERRTVKLRHLHL